MMTIDFTASSYHGVIFDLDGTLLDTLADIGDSVNRMLGEYGFGGHGIDDYRHFIGNGIHKLVARSLPSTARSEVMIERCVQRARDIYWDNWNRKTRPYDGIQDLLTQLTGNGLPLAVLSNKPHDFTKRYVEAYFPEVDFQIVLGQKEQFPAKPDPTSAIYIAEQMGLPPSAFLFVGDSAADMQTAAAAGMLAVGVAWGFRGAGELIENGCRHIVNHPLDILPLLEA